MYLRNMLAGAKDDRTELNRLLSIVKEGDTIYTSDCSRLTRSLKHLMRTNRFCKGKENKANYGRFYC